ncbi:HNH endonuclease, partial [Gordonia sputi]|nr:HNH endonuclease [Gordonia sputi]
MPPLPTLLAELRDIRIDDDANAREIHAATTTLMMMRNVVDHLLAVHAAAMDRLGVAGPGGKTRALLIAMGAAP